jgi:hypothetical protein
MLTIKVRVIAQVHQDEDVLKELKCMENTLEGIEVIDVGFDGKIDVKVTADTMELLISKIWSLARVNYITDWGITECPASILQGLPLWMHPCAKT